MPARSMAATTAMTDVATTTQTTVSANMAWLESALSPCLVMRSAKLRPPITTTPTARIAIASPATTNAARAIRAAMPPVRLVITARSRGSRGARSRRVGGCHVFCGRRSRRGPIAHAANGCHVARPFRVVAELFAQPTDMNVDRAIEHFGLVVAVHRVEKLIASEHPPVGLEEGDEQAELDGGQW